MREFKEILTEGTDRTIMMKKKAKFTKPVNIKSGSDLVESLNGLYNIFQSYFFECDVLIDEEPTNVVIQNTNSKDKVQIWIDNPIDKMFQKPWIETTKKLTKEKILGVSTVNIIS